MAASARDARRRMRPERVVVDVLARVYAHIWTLSSYLQWLLQDRWQRITITPDMAHFLETILVVPAPCLRLPGLVTDPGPERPRARMGKVIARVLEMLLREAERPSNVLAFGYGRRKLTSGGVLGGVCGVENFYPNTLVNYLQTQAWEQLLALLGENVAMHLLLDTSLFLRFDEGNVIQLTGAPVSEFRLNSGLIEPVAGNAVGPQHVVLPGAVGQPETPALHGGSRTRFTSRNIFFSWTRHEQLPCGHALRQARASRRGAIRLLHAIFSSCIPRWTLDGRLPARLLGAVENFRGLIVRFESLDTAHLLQQCCPTRLTKAEPLERQTGSAPVDTAPRDTQENFTSPFFTQCSEVYSGEPRHSRWKDQKRRQRNIIPHEPADGIVPYPNSYPALIQRFSTYAQVTWFLQRYMSELLPEELFGSAHNRTQILKKLGQYVALLRFERFSVKQLMSSIR